VAIGRRLKRALFGGNQGILGLKGTTVDIVLRYLMERVLGHCCL
tara:strand:+ start:34 stop:165 length:132 start_codon:yes stop_codon:yes gene_type:complete